MLGSFSCTNIDLLLSTICAPDLRLGAYNRGSRYQNWAARALNMINKAFFKAGHAPTLLSAFFYFDMSFMVWVMLGPLGVQIASTLHLDAAQKGLMVAVPVLAGALLRIVSGV